MRLESLAVADGLAVHAAGACSSAERAPIPLEEMPTAGETPVIVRQWGTDQAIEGANDLEVGSSQGAGLERGRDGPTGVENLGPSWRKIEAL